MALRKLAEVSTGFCFIKSKSGVSTSQRLVIWGAGLRLSLVRFVSAKAFENWSFYKLKELDTCVNMACKTYPEGEEGLRVELGSESGNSSGRVIEVFHEGGE